MQTSKDISCTCVSPEPTGIDDAVGLAKTTHSVNAADQACRWYIAVVNNNSEKSVRDKLTALGHTCYVATQSHVRVLRSGRRVRSEQVVIRAAVFIRCSEPERRRIVAYPFIKRFMTDRAVCAKGRPATVPEREMQTLRFILGNSDSPVTIIDRPLRRGDRVRIVRGGLRGLEGEILDPTGGDSELLIELSVLGCALLRISRLNIEPLPAPKI